MYYSYELDTTRLEVEVLGILLVPLLVSIAFRKRRVLEGTRPGNPETAVVDKETPSE